MSTDARQPNIEAIYYLSPMQQGMLFHSLYAPEHWVYFEQWICLLEGELQIAAFERAWQQVVARHSLLRTAFIWEGREKMIQVVQREVTLPFEYFDWRAEAAEKQADYFTAYLQTDRERGFKFTQAPLMRLALMRVGETAHRFVWSHHHILLDGWSLPLVLKEVFAFYEAFSSGQHLKLPAPRPYRDYINWLQAQDLNQAEKFWRQALKGFTAPTPLGIDRAVSDPTEQPAKQTYAKHEVLLSTAATTALQQLARQRQLTLNTLVQGAWAILLSRYSGETEVLFGATVSGRPPELPGVETMVGLFINALPVRTQVLPGARLLSWLKMLQTQQLELRQYEYSPLVQIRGWSEVPPGQPLFESLLIFENYPTDASLRARNASLEIKEVQLMERTNYPVTLMASVPRSQLSLRITYDGNRFAGATIQQMLKHLRQLLESIAANPEQRVANLSLLDGVERQQLLALGKPTPTRAQPLGGLLHGFEAQVERMPEAWAVSGGGQRLTYRHLNERANQLAHYLRRRGVAPETRVAVCLERSPEMLVGLLGILKAGGAYVPLDPAYPADRLAFMLTDSGASVVLSQRALAPTLPATTAPVVCLDTDWPSIAQSLPGPRQDGAISNPSPDSAGTGPSLVMPDSLAYILYTSGSTGRPKGVQISHHALGNCLWAMAERPGLSAADVLLAVTTLSFDIAALELFLPLLVGAQVSVANREIAADPTQLGAVLAQVGATVMQATPASWRMLLASGWAGQPGLKVLCGGEALPADLAEQLRARVGSVWNMYGPTETTIWSAVSAVEAAEATPTWPLGRPIANTELYVLDDRLQLTPQGVLGELYIGGAGLARGYLNRPDLTAERFVPNPFAPSASPPSPPGGDTGEGGARLYRTGDLVRYRADGQLEFVGRLDHQVKVRGFRVELGEIEAALAQHPAVQAGVVVARDDLEGLGLKDLVAYLVAGAAAPTAADLRNFLQERLPDYMVPTGFVFLETLPLTPNGKIDRRALPAPEGKVRQGAVEYVAPRSAVEEVLVEIWGNVLGVERVGVHDNFFNLGGHSLNAVLVLTRVRESLQVNLPLRHLFEATTVAKLAEVIRQHEKSPGQAEKTAQVLRKIKDASPEALRAMLEQKRRERGQVSPNISA